MKVKRSHAVISFIVALIAAYYCWWLFVSGDVFSSAKQNAPHRSALTALHHAIDLGMSYPEVLSAYWKHRSRELRLSPESDAVWSVRMPGEFGAHDWMLLIEFRDARVSAVRVRTSDGPPPTDGPQDKQKVAG